MSNLVYSVITSLDGYIADADGGFEWAAPSEEVHAFVNDLERPVGTYLYGRRMYETMAVWETMGEAPEQRDVSRDYAEIWRAAEKVVYSTTLEAVTTPRTRLERSFDPEAIRQMKASASHDISVGGATLGAVAITADLVDEWHLIVVPHVVGGGTAALPDNVRLQLDLRDAHSFANGTVHLHYRTVR